MKYHNKPTRSFDSRLEFYRNIFLLDEQRKGVIRNLRRQVKFEVIPQQTIQVRQALKTKEKIVERVAERACYYIADFVYEVRCDGGWRMVVEDTKSEVTRRLPDYVMKRKLMRLHGTPIHEVLRATETIK